jgi:hypothetical protein
VITKYDPVTRSIEGNFELTLIKTYGFRPDDADALQFTEGDFKGVIRN